jgi:hypothetical protein
MIGRITAIQREQLFEYVFGSGCGKGKAVAIGSNLLPIKLCQYVHVFAWASFLLLMILPRFGNGVFPQRFSHRDRWSYPG